MYLHEGLIEVASRMMRKTSNRILCLIRNVIRNASDYCILPILYKNWRSKNNLNVNGGLPFAQSNLQNSISTLFLVIEAMSNIYLSILVHRDYFNDLTFANSQLDNSSNICLVAAAIKPVIYLCLYIILYKLAASHTNLV